MAGMPFRLGIMGGTFDPIHHGHLIVASELRAALDLDRVLLMPNARSPFKDDVSVSGPEDRLAMLRLAIDGIPWLDVSTIELERGGVSFTSDTLSELAATHPAARLVFLMGADALGDLPRWHRPDRIVSLAEIGVASRPGVTTDIDVVVAALPAAEGRVTVVPTPLIAISATDIRRRIRDARPIAFHVPAAVERYIRTNRLYTD